MKITAALIVKNEEQCLARCLRSIAGAADEIIVVDTGSDDDTKAVARRFTDRIFDYRWHDDFAAARNFSFQQATGDWIFWVDADDVLNGAGKIRPMIEQSGAAVDVFFWRYISAFDDWGNPICEFWRERCIRNDGSFQWEGRIHEVLVNSRQHRAHRTEEVVVHHRPDPGRIPAKLRRNIDLLTAQQAEEGETSPRTLFYLANEYGSSGDNRTALDFFRRYMKVAVWEDERYIVQTRIAAIYRSFGNYRQAVDADLRALKICPHWPDAYFGLAESYYYLNDWHKVIHWSEMGRAMPTPDTTHIVNPMKYAYHWIIYYTNALYQVGEVREALKWTKRALEICPQGPWHSENFLMFSEALQGTAGMLTSASESTRDRHTAKGSREHHEDSAEPKLLAREAMRAGMPALRERSYEQTA